MKVYSFIEPHRLDQGISVEIVFTREDVLKFYWQYWKEQMESRGFDNSIITEENCIDDFVVGNWATVCEDHDMGIPEYGVVRMDYDMWKDYDKRMQSKDCHGEA